MANQVTYTNLFSESRNNIVALISNTSNVSDPTTSTSEFRKWIYSREPDIKSVDFKGYPFIIIYPAKVEVDEMGSLDGKTKFVNWNIEIEVITSDRGHGEKDGQGLSNMDAISDDIIQTLLNMTSRNTLSVNAMKFSKPIANDVVTEVMENELVYRRSITCPFKNRITISA